MPEENIAETTLIVQAQLGVQGLQKVDDVLLTQTGHDLLPGERQNIETMISQHSGKI